MDRFIQKEILKDAADMIEDAAYSGEFNSVEQEIMDEIIRKLREWQ